METVYVLCYKMNKQAMGLYYKAPWPKKGAYPEMCISFRDSWKTKNIEEAENLRKMLEESTDLKWRIEEHEYLDYKQNNN